jgi:broad-specificity NMP kinase
VQHPTLHFLLTNQLKPKKIMKKFQLDIQLEKRYSVAELAALLNCNTWNVDAELKQKGYKKTSVLGNNPARYLLKKIS